MIAIYVDSPAFSIPLCRDVTGKEMKLACIYNIGPEHTVIYVEGTPLRYGLLQSEFRHCVVTGDKELVVMFPSILYSKDRNCVLESTHPELKNVLCDGEFQFTRDGFVNLNGYRIKYSNHGNSFVYANHDAAVDSQGYLWAKDYLENNFYRPWVDYEQMPQDPRFIFAMNGGRLGLTQDRRIWYVGKYITEIPDPVIDIADGFFSFYGLTCSGEVYFVNKSDKNLQAVLIAQGATAISDIYQSHYFAFSDEQANLHIYEDFRYGSTETKPKRIIKTGTGRVSELFFDQDQIVCKYVPYGCGRYWASSGEAILRW